MVFQTIGILVGVIYYVTSIRNQNRTRQIQIISTVGTGDLNWGFLNWEVGDYDDFMSEHGSEANPEDWGAVNAWFNRLEYFDVYVREGLLDVRLICLMSVGTIKESWEKYRGKRSGASGTTGPETGLRQSTCTRGWLNIWRNIQNLASDRQILSSHKPISLENVLII